MKKRFALCAIGVAGLALLVITIGGIGENLVYYWGPTELRNAGTHARGATIRLGGLVAAGSVRYVNETSLLEFDVTDMQNIVHVRSTGVPPQMFREGIGVVVEGTMTRAGHFESSRLMVKHGNEYQAPTAGEPVDAGALIESTRYLRSADRP